MKNLKKKRHLAIDSTGLGTNQYVRWQNAKSKRKDFKKFHVCGESTGKEKIIYSAEVIKATKGDSPMLSKLLSKVSGTIGDTSADKAYCGRKNAQCIAEKGGTPYIAIKENVKPLSKGYPAWKEMIYKYRANKNHYLKHYHKRSNGEAIFWSYKKREGAHLVSRKRKTRMNEVYLKVITYNLRLLAKRFARLGYL